MIILLTGTTGYIGRHLAEQLIKTQHELYCIVRNTSDISKICVPSERIYRYEKDEQLYDIMQEIKPDIIIHIAGMFLSEHSKENIVEMLQSNVAFPTVLLDAAEKAGCKGLINTGSYWQNFEGEEYNPVNLYAATKQAFEALIDYYVEAKKWKVITLTLFDVFGPNDTRNKVLNLVHRLKPGEELDMSLGKQKLYMCYIDDVVEAYIRAIELLESRQYGTAIKYEVRDEESFALREIIELYLKIAKKEVKLNWGKRPYRTREIMDIERKGMVLEGWSPKYDLAEGLKQYEMNWTK